MAVQPRQEVDLLLQAPGGGITTLKTLDGLQTPGHELDLVEKEVFQLLLGHPGKENNGLTLLICGGKKDKLRPGDILGALVKEAGLEGTDIGNIKILPTISYVAIDKKKAQDKLKIIQNLRIKGIKFKIEKA